MINPLLDHPTPDFAELVRVLKGEQAPRRVHLIEIGIDAEVLRQIVETYTGDPWILPNAGFEFTASEAYYHQLAKLYYRLGYDYVPIWATWPNHPSPRQRVTADTAELSRGQRTWIEEGQGLITSWDDFERFPWDAIHGDITQHTSVARHLPEGMKVITLTSFFEHVFENLLGFEGLAFLLYDEPELVEQVFERWGQKVYEYYQKTISMDAVGAIFHADDMGFKTSSLLSPRMLRKLVLPWHKKFAALAHDYGKPFFIHSCGNLFVQGLIEDLIEDVRIDGFHSFQDVILPVTEFKARYNGRVATLGGVDIDVMVRADEESLRRYIRHILDRCMPGGRYAMGTGNTVANYVPLDHYLIMLEESRNWQHG